MHLSLSASMILTRKFFSRALAILLPILPPPVASKKRRTHVRLTYTALKEVSSRLPLEIKAFSPEHHGGEQAIIAAVQAKEENGHDAGLECRHAEDVKSLRFKSWLVLYQTHGWLVRTIQVFNRSCSFFQGL